MNSLELKTKDFNVTVGHPLFDPNKAIGSVMVTSIFRGGAYINEVMEVVRGNQLDERELIVDSLGCSVFAEGDSVLGSQHASGDPRPINILGVDISRKALRQAKQGVQRIPVIDHPAIKIGHTSKKSMLAEYGIDVDLTTVHHDDETGEEYYAADTQSIRAWHKVSFLAHDLRHPILGNRRPHLTLLNNVLYHDIFTGLEPLIVQREASRLASGGVLSMDFTTLQAINKRVSEPTGLVDGAIDWISRTCNLSTEKIGPRNEHTIFVANK